MVEADGYIVTNNHVVTLDGDSSSGTISVRTTGGRIYRATIVGTDPLNDLAVIKLAGASGLKAATFADSSKLNVGDTAIAIGAPLGLANTVTNGIVSALNRSISVASSAVPSTPDGGSDGNGGQNGPFNFWDFGDGDGGNGQSTSTSSVALAVIQTDAAINPGNSGGALLDSSGNVIGVNVAIASAGSSGGGQSGNIGVGFAIPSNTAQRIAQEIIDTGSASHALLGVTASTAADDGSAVGTGAELQSVSDGSPADEAGLRPGDVITAVGDRVVTTSTELTAAVRSAQPGDTVTLTVRRDGDTSTVDVTLDAASD